MHLLQGSQQPLDERFLLLCLFRLNNMVQDPRRLLSGGRLVVIQSHARDRSARRNELGFCLRFQAIWRLGRRVAGT